jgi:hypothetical protein
MQACEIVPGMYRSKGKRLQVQKVTRHDDGRLLITYQWMHGYKPKTSLTRAGAEWNMEADVEIIEEDLV